MDKSVGEGRVFSFFMLFAALLSVKVLDRVNEFPFFVNIILALVISTVAGAIIVFTTTVLKELINNKRNP